VRLAADLLASFGAWPPPSPIPFVSGPSAEYCARGSLYDLLQEAREKPALRRALDWPRRIVMALDAAKVGPWRAGGLHETRAHVAVNAAYARMCSSSGDGGGGGGGAGWFGTGKAEKLRGSRAPVQGSCSAGPRSDACLH
jgi:hypothetical protein